MSARRLNHTAGIAPRIGMLNHSDADDCDSPNVSRICGSAAVTTKES